MKFTSLSIALTFSSFICFAQVTDDGTNVGINKGTPLTELHISGGSSSELIWPLWVENSKNGSTITNYGVGIKLKHSHNGELGKWSGIASIQESSWANNSGLALFANETEYLRIKANGRIGIGTSEPETHLHVKASGWAYSKIEGGSNSAAILELANSNVTWQVQTDQTNNFVLRDKTSNSKRLIIDPNGDVGIGTDNTFGYRLAVNGTIGSTEVKVENTSAWPDFVFENNYELRTLEEIEQHINENGHLPEIPSEAEVSKNGINLGEMDAKLLQKIEELTLYMIDMNKQVQQLKSENQELKEKVSSLENK